VSVNTNDTTTGVCSLYLEWLPEVDESIVTTGGHDDISHSH